MKQKLKPRSLARVILALAIVISILVGSSYATIMLTRKRLNNFAETMAEQQSAYVNVVTNMTFISADWIINSFMAGFADLECNSDELVNHTKSVKYYISDNTISRLTTDEVYDRLESFISYHSDFSSVVMIFEPGVLSDAPNGIAAKVASGDATHYNLCEEYDIFNSRFYRKVCDSVGIVSQAGCVSEDSIFVSTIGLPFYDHHGRLLGQFWIDTDADAYSDILNFCKSDDDVAAALISDDCRIIASTHKDNNGAYIKTVSVNICDGHFPAEWYNIVRQCVLSNEKCHFRYAFDGEHVVTYVFPIASSPYRLLIIKPESKLYSRVQDFIWVPIFILIVSILLVSLCLAYLFMVIKHKNDESARMQGELNIAADIQRSILPANPDNCQLSPKPTADNCQLSIVNCQLKHPLPQFDIYGFQRPAKTVGGDLYDFAQKGHLLHFCIGDVSGKGMPAALVMTELCSLYRYIISHCSDPREIVSRINNAIMERSDDSMFCSLFVGVLDLRTGVLQYCNAGHNPPILIPGPKSLVLSPETRYLSVKPNILVNAFANFDYQAETLQMHPGDRLFLYTDGVTEAKNKANHFFGNDATLASVDSHKQLPFNQMIDAILHDISRFVGKAEQHDDITMLCIEYDGSGDRYLTRLSGSGTCPLTHYDTTHGRVVEIVDDTLRASGMPDNMKLRLAIEETVQNISDYAYDEDGPLDILVSRDDTAIQITLIDSGKPFNPLEAAAPDLSSPIMDREIGGLGIFLTRQIMSEVNYKYEDDKNILEMIYQS